MDRNDSSHMVYSFDVFDTCITRNVARPTDLFWLLGREVMRQSGVDDPTPDDISDFRICRINAERAARQNAAREDITLAEIYRELDWLDARGLSAESGMDAEVELERESIRPIPAAVVRIQKARESGARVLFLSDMYLPSEFIRDMLLKYDIAQPTDPVYVSGEVGLSKHTGSLFHHVAAEENVSFGNWRHVGDNPGSDHAVPSRLGIQAECWVPSEMSAYEECAYAGLGEVETSSLLAGTMRSVRLQKPTEDRRADIVRSMGVDIGGPLLTAFVLDVLQKARDDGVERLYFLSRRGQLLFKVAQVFQEEYAEIEFQYLQGSRRAWRPVAYLNWCRELWDAIIERSSELSVEKIIDLVGLDNLKEQEECLRLFNNNPDREAMYEWLSQPSRRTIIEKNLAERRVDVLDYLESEGLWEKRRIGLVDDGWTGGTQRDLNHLLHAKPAPPEVIGFYLGLTLDCTRDRACGAYHCFLSQDREGSIPGSPVRRVIQHIMMLETAFLCCTDGQCKGYARSGTRVEPVLDESDTGWAQTFISAWHDGVLDFAEAWQKEERRGSPNVLERAALTNAANFLRHPPASWAEAFLGLGEPVDIAGIGHIPLVKKLSFSEVWQEKNPQAAKTACGGQVSHWHEGSLAISSRWVRAAASLGRHGLRQFLRQRLVLDV